MDRLTGRPTHLRFEYLAYGSKILKSVLNNIGKKSVDSNFSLVDMGYGDKNLDSHVRLADTGVTVIDSKVIIKCSSIGF